MQLLIIRSSLLAGMVCLLFLTIGCAGFSPSITPDKSDNLQGAFKDFDSFVTNICGDYLEKGRKSQLSLSGKAKAKLDSLLTKIVDLNFSGETGYDVSEYENVSREHLAEELQSKRACRLVLWNDLKTTLPFLKDSISQFESTKTIELNGEIVTFGKPFDIVAKELTAHNATIRAVPNDKVAHKARSGQNGADGNRGSHGAGDPGSAGADGGAGTHGSASENVDPITITVSVLSGTLSINSSGAAGQYGGDGGRGGNGGNGGDGRAGVNGLFGCKRGPGSGGSGGNAGQGGNAGNGGNGADAGHVTIIADEVRPGTKIVVTSNGSKGGQPGKPGQQGKPGKGGVRGSAPSTCSKKRI